MSNGGSDDTGWQRWRATSDGIFMRCGRVCLLKGALILTQQIAQFARSFCGSVYGLHDGGFDIQFLHPIQRQLPER